MVGEHDSFEPGFLGDRCEFQKVVGVGEGECLPELHDEILSNPGRVMARSIAKGGMTGQRRSASFPVARFRWRPG